MDHYIQYATRDSKIVHISEVESGLACGCYCAHCNTQLVAKKGMKVVHHFAHYCNEECELAYESSLHLGVKRVLENERRFLFPPIIGQSLFRKNETLKKAMLLSLDTVRIERRIESIIPDILVTVGTAECILEIYVTHQVDDEKKGKSKASTLQQSKLTLVMKKEASTIKGSRKFFVIILALNTGSSILSREHYVVSSKELKERKLRKGL